MKPIHTPETEPWPSVEEHHERIPAYLERDLITGTTTLTVPLNSLPDRVIIGGVEYIGAELVAKGLPRSADPGALV